MAEKLFPKEIVCPGCSASLALDKTDRLSGEFTCPECDTDIRLYETSDPIYEDKANSCSGNISISAEGLGDEVLKGIHSAKSYVGMAFLTLLFYYVGFYIVGLICNFVFISQANNSKQISGKTPSGWGCLILLIWIHVVIPAIVFIVLAFCGALASFNL